MIGYTLTPYPDDAHALVWYHATPVDNVAQIELEGLDPEVCIDAAVHLSQRDRSALAYSLQFNLTPDIDFEQWEDSDEGFDPSRIALYRVSLEGIDAAAIFEGIDDELEDCAVRATIPPKNLERIR